MKLTHIAMLLTATTLGLTGCQATKNFAENLTLGENYNAKLPTQSSSRVQFVIKNRNGYFRALPNSKGIIDTRKGQATIADTVGFIGSKSESAKEVSLSDLGLPKPSLTLDPKRKNNNIVERYVTPNEQIVLTYDYSYDSGRVKSHCDISGRLTAKPNTDYRVTGWTDYQKCYIILEEFVKNADGSITPQPRKFEIF